MHSLRLPRQRNPITNKKEKAVIIQCPTQVYFDAMQCFYGGGSEAVAQRYSVFSSKVSAGSQFQGAILQQSSLIHCRLLLHDKPAFLFSIPSSIKTTKLFWRLVATDNGIPVDINQAALNELDRIAALLSGKQTAAPAAAAELKQADTGNLVEIDLPTEVRCEINTVFICCYYAQMIENWGALHAMRPFDATTKKPIIERQFNAQRNVINLFHSKLSTLLTQAPNALLSIEVNDLSEIYLFLFQQMSSIYLGLGNLCEEQTHQSMPLDNLPERAYLSLFLALNKDKTAKGAIAMYYFASSFHALYHKTHDIKHMVKFLNLCTQVITTLQSTLKQSALAKPKTSFGHDRNHLLVKRLLEHLNVIFKRIPGNIKPLLLTQCNEKTQALIHEPVNILPEDFQLSQLLTGDKGRRITPISCMSRLNSDARNESAKTDSWPAKPRSH